PECLYVILKKQLFPVLIICCKILTAVCYSRMPRIPFSPQNPQKYVTERTARPQQPRHSASAEATPGMSSRKRSIKNSICPQAGCGSL
uniref:Uncharacterized protein n=1 Tax=Astyanax mexicanus TaxID=7994 RepID=A0A3B1J212_ASTMX